MDNIDKINELFSRVGADCTKLSQLLDGQNVTYELIRGDLEALGKKKQQIIADIKELENQAVASTNMAQKIIDTANEKATEIIEGARARNAESIKLLEEVKPFCHEVDKKRQVELKNKVMANSK